MRECVRCRINIEKGEPFIEIKEWANEKKLKATKSMHRNCWQIFLGGKKESSKLLEMAKQLMVKANAKLEG